MPQVSYLLCIVFIELTAEESSIKSNHPILLIGTLHDQQLIIVIIIINTNYKY